MITEGTKRWTEQLKACGQSIIDNAERIADIAEYQTELNVHIRIAGRKTPVIEMDTEWLPERLLEDAIPWSGDTIEHDNNNRT